jgi:hypothetical protein
MKSIFKKAGATGCVFCAVTLLFSNARASYVNFFDPEYRRTIAVDGIKKLLDQQLYNHAALALQSIKNADKNTKHALYFPVLSALPTHPVSLHAKILETIKEQSVDNVSYDFQLQELILAFLAIVAGDGMYYLEHEAQIIRESLLEKYEHICNYFLSIFRCNRISASTLVIDESNCKVATNLADAYLDAFARLPLNPVAVNVDLSGSFGELLGYYAELHFEDNGEQQMFEKSDKIRAQAYAEFFKNVSRGQSLENFLKAPLFINSSV